MIRTRARRFPRSSGPSRVTRLSLAAAATLLGLSSVSWGVSNWGLVGTGDWFTATNWSPNGVPGSATVVHIDNGGTAQISGGSAVATSVDLGSGIALSGTLTLSGGSLSMTSTLNVGDHGDGTMGIAGGGVVSSAVGRIGLFAGTTGKFTVDGAGSQWNNSTSLTIAGGGNGTLEITAGGLVSNTTATIANLAGSIGKVTVDGAGSQWKNSGNVIVGSLGNGTLEISAGGLVTVGSGGTGTLTLGNSVGGVGVLKIGTGGTAGTLAAAQVTTGAGAGQVIFNHTNDLTFAPLLSGTLSVSKLGAGTTTLTNANTYTGNTTVDEGSLIVNGSIKSPTTTVNIAGLLGGSGTIGGAVINNGVVSPGNSPGTLTVSGPYMQYASGTLLIQIGGRNAGEHDLLAVGGAATLGGTVHLVRLNNFQLAVGDHIVFLTAGGGVSGTFALEDNEFATGTIIKGKVVYSASEVALEGAQGSFADVPQLIKEEYPQLHFSFLDKLTPNQSAVAHTLDDLFKKHGVTKLIGYLDHRPLLELPGDFDAIAPEEFTAIYRTAVSLATLQSLNLQRRTEDLRSGASGFSAQGLAINGQTPSYSGSFGILSGTAGPTGDSSKDSKAIYTPAPDNKWGVFLSGTGEWIDVDGDGNARGYDITTGGFTLGLDYKVTPSFAVGISAGYAGTTADLTNDGRVWINGGKVGCYATYFTGGFYTDVAVGGGYNNYDTKRSALQGAARGSTDGGELNVLFSTGYDLTFGALKIGPTATFNYTHVGFNSFTEHGSLAPLFFPDQSGESIRSAFGLKASYDWKIGGVIVKPELRAAWQHEYADNDYAMDSSFANGAGNIFRVRGPRIGRDSLMLGGGVAVQFNARTAAYLYYDGQIARENYSSHSVTGGLRVTF